MFAEVETAAQAWSPWFIAAWVVWGAVFVLLEATALLRRDDDRPPLTQVVRRYVPVLVVLPGLVWLLWHAVETYSRAAP